MKDNIFFDIPVAYESIADATKALQFNMASELYTGSLLKTLVASKPSGRFLELGTGSGLATSWMIAGMDAGSELVTVENNALLQIIAKTQLQDDRVSFVLANGYEWIRNYAGKKFDLIFADAMPGKYDLFDETITLVRNGGFYIIDDMLPQPNWPDGHAEKVPVLLNLLANDHRLLIAPMAWASGVVVAVRKPADSRDNRT